MTRKTFFLMLLMLALVIALPGCGGDTTESTPASTAAADPTATPEPAPTDTPEPAPTDPPTAVPSEDVVIQGRPLVQFYVDTCGGCHGTFREGSVGPALIPGRLTADREFIFNTIKNGSPGTSMEPFGGELFLEDSEINALVDYVLSEPSAEAFIWGEEQIRNTITVSYTVDQLPSEPTHTGNMDNLFLVTERDNRAVVVLDGDTHTMLARIPATYRAHGYTFDPSNERWAYNLGRDGWLLKIDLYSLQPVAVVRIGIDSRAIAISDDGRYVIGGNYIPNTAVIVDTETMEPVKIITAEGNDPSGNFIESRVGGINATLSDHVGPYFLINLKDAGQVWRVDYSDPEFPIVKTENVGEILHEAFLTPDQKIFYVTSQASNWMAVIDVETMEIVTKIPTGTKPHPGQGAIWEDSSGDMYAATLHIQDSAIFIWDVATNTEVARIPTVGPGLFVGTNPHSPYVWGDALFSVSAPNTFYAVEKDPPFTPHPIVIEDAVQLVHPETTADGNFVYISDWGGNKVYVVDAHTFEVVTVIEGIITPTGIFNSSRRDETLGH